MVCLVNIHGENDVHSDALIWGEIMSANSNNSCVMLWNICPKIHEICRNGILYFYYIHDIYPSSTKSDLDESEGDSYKFSLLWAVGVLCVVKTISYTISFWTFTSPISVTCAASSLCFKCYICQVYSNKKRKEKTTHSSLICLYAKNWTSQISTEVV